MSKQCSTALPSSQSTRRQFASYSTPSPLPRPDSPGLSYPRPIPTLHTPQLLVPACSKLTSVSVLVLMTRNKGSASYPAAPDHTPTPSLTTASPSPTPTTHPDNTAQRDIFPAPSCLHFPVCFPAGRLPELKLDQDWGIPRQDI